MRSALSPVLGPSRSLGAHPALRRIAQGFMFDLSVRLSNEGSRSE
jgi:hypothetical protein